MAPFLLQTPPSALAIAGTYASLAVFLSVTAHIAARNVLGDVPVRKAFAVGPVPAAIAVLFTAMSWSPAVALGLAVVVDGVLVRYVYGRGARLSAYVTFIHVVVSLLLGTVLFSLYALALTAPG